MPAYKDEKSGKWFASFYYKDWDGQSRKKLKRGFETKKEAITYERNFTVAEHDELRHLKVNMNDYLGRDKTEEKKKSIIGAIKRHQAEDKEKLKEKKEASKEAER